MRETKSSRNPTSTPATWEEMLRRLQAVQAKLAQDGVPTVEETRAILKARAKFLAQEPQQTTRASAELELVEFKLAHERYAIESHYIREVLPLRDFSPVPCTPAFVLGLVNVRGQLLSIIDLKRFFGLAVKELDSHNHAIVLHNRTMEFCVLADSLSGVLHISRQSLQSSLPTLTGIRNEFLLGITPERTTVLDADKLLLSRELVVYEEVEI